MTAPVSSDSWRPVFRAGRQGRKVAWVWAGSWVGATACLWAGWVVRSDGVGWTLLIWALAVSFAVGMEGYRRHYVSALDTRPPKLLRVLVYRWGRPHWIEVPMSALRAGRVRTGEWATESMSGAAPYVTLHRAGRRIPFVVDLQGDAVDPGTFARLTRTGQPLSFPTR